MRGCSKVSSKSAPLQAGQAQLSQPVIHSRGAPALEASLWPPLHSLQQLHMLVTLGVPDLKAERQVGSQESRAQGENPLPLSAAHTAGEEPQDTGVSGLPAHMAAYGQLSIHNAPRSLSAELVSIFCPSACLHIGGCRCPGPGVPMLHPPQATNTQAITQQRETHETLKT